MPELHCPVCKVRITPYEHHVNDKGQNACWHCDTPMSEILPKLGMTELPPPPVTLSEAEQEIARLKAEVERLKAAGAFGPAAKEEAKEEVEEDTPPVEVATPHRGPGRPRKSD